MALTSPMGFEIQAPEPIDNRTLKETIADRDNIPTVLRHEGLPVYVMETGMMYYLIGGITNANWVAAGDLSGTLVKRSYITQGTAGQEDFVIPDADPGEISEVFMLTIGAVAQSSNSYIITTTNVTNDTIHLTTPLEESTTVSFDYFKYVKAIDDYVDHADIYFESAAPNYKVLFRGYKFKVSSKTDFDGTITLFTSDDVPYTIGDAVEVGDYLKAEADTAGARSSMILKKA